MSPIFLLKYIYIYIYIYICCLFVCYWFVLLFYCWERWVARQRELAKKRVLPRDRRAKLDDLGFVWNTNDEAWDTRYKQLLSWAEVNGHACVPIANGDLGLWVAKQRQMKRKGKLAAERERLLNEARFTWDTPSADWNEKFAELVRWKELHGDCRVPFNSPSADGLGWWVNTQRQAKRKGKMTRERQERLDAIGFIWSPQETARTSRSSRLAAIVAGSSQAPSPRMPSSPNTQPLPPASLSIKSLSSARRASAKRKIDDHPAPVVVATETGTPPAAPTKRHHSFALGDPPSQSALPGMASSDSSLISIYPHFAETRSSSRRATSFGVFTPPIPSPSVSPMYLSGASTPSSGGLYSGEGSSSNSLLPKPFLPPLLFSQQQNLTQSASTSRPPPMSPPQNASPPGHTSSSSLLPFSPLPPISSLNPLRSALYRRRRPMFQDRRRAISFPSIPKSSPSPTLDPPMAHMSAPITPLPSQLPLPCAEVQVPAQAALHPYPLTDLANLAVSSGAVGPKRGRAEAVFPTGAGVRRSGTSRHLPPMDAPTSSSSGGLFRSILERRS